MYQLLCQPPNAREISFLEIHEFRPIYRWSFRWKTENYLDETRLRAQVANQGFYRGDLRNFNTKSGFG